MTPRELAQELFSLSVVTRDVQGSSRCLETRQFVRYRSDPDQLSLFTGESGCLRAGRDLRFP